MPAQARRRRWIGVAAIVGSAGVIAAVIALGRGGPFEPPLYPSGRSSPADTTPPGEPRSDAGGGSPPVGNAEQAVRLVASARTAVAVGNLAHARGLLTRAYALDPRPDTLLELGRVDYQTGHCRDARRATQRVIELVPGGPVADDARDLLGRIGRCD